MIGFDFMPEIRRDDELKIPAIVKFYFFCMCLFLVPVVISMILRFF